MQSIIVIGKSQGERHKQALALCEGIDGFDIRVIESEKAIGIDEIRTLRQTILLTPLKGVRRAFVIHATEGMTIQAQNAFLKTLEEPPVHALLIITASSKDIFLPTVLSRCHIRLIKQEDQSEKIIKLDQSNEFILSLMSKDLKKSLKIAQDFGKTKQETLAFTERSMQSLQVFLHEGWGKRDRISLISCVDALKNLQDAYVLLSTTNVNPRFILEAVLLRLPQTN